MRNATISMLITAITAVPAIAGAQAHHKAQTNFTMFRGHNAKHQPVPFFARPHTAAKTTATDVRLVSYADLRHDGTAYVPQDSVTYSYTGTRGGTYYEDYVYWNWNADVQHSYQYDNTSSTYDPADAKYSYTYDASGNLTMELDQEWNSGTSSWDNAYKYVYSYNASGNPTSEVDYEWNTATSSWDSTYKTTFTYSATNKMIGVLQKEWNTTSLAWDNMWQSTITRDASDRMVTEIGQFWAGVTWMNALRYTYNYDASGNRINEMTEMGSMAGWDTSSIIVHSSFTSNHQPQTNVSMNWDTATHAFVNSYREHYTYNSYGKPDYYFDETWDTAGSGSWGVDTYATATRYHYETYNTAPTIVETVADNSSTFSVYPVPAANTLNISATREDAQPFTVSIMDMSGRVFTTWTVTDKKQYQQAIPINDLPQGNYVISLQGNKGRESKQFSVVR